MGVSAPSQVRRTSARVRSRHCCPGHTRNSPIQSVSSGVCELKATLTNRYRPPNCVCRKPCHVYYMDRKHQDYFSECDVFYLSSYSELTRPVQLPTNGLMARLSTSKTAARKARTTTRPVIRLDLLQDREVPRFRGNFKTARESVLSGRWSDPWSL